MQQAATAKEPETADTTLLRLPDSVLQHIISFLGLQDDRIRVLSSCKCLAQQLLQTCKGITFVLRVAAAGASNAAVARVARIVHWAATECSTLRLHVVLVGGEQEGLWRSHVQLMRKACLVGYLPTVTRLTLQNMQVDAPLLAEMAPALPNVTQLQFEDCTLTPAAWHALAINFPSLNRITFCCDPSPCSVALFVFLSLADTRGAHSPPLQLHFCRGQDGSTRWQQEVHKLNRHTQAAGFDFITISWCEPMMELE